MTDAGGGHGAEPVSDAPIVARLALRRLDDDHFEGRHPEEPSPLARPVPGRAPAVHVFGGLILGQALRSAHLTVPVDGGGAPGPASAADGTPAVAGEVGRRRPASVQASFLRAGRGRSAGSADAWYSSPSSSTWNVACRISTGSASWMATTRRTEKARPSRVRSTE